MNKWTIRVGNDVLASHIGQAARSALEAAKAASAYASHGEMVTVSATHLKRPRLFLCTRLGVSEVNGAA